MERKKSGPEVLVVHFLVPKFDRSGKPYPRSVHKNLRKNLEQRFGGWSSLGDKPLPGAWMNPDSGEIEYDESWRYEVGIAPKRLAELDEYLAELAYHLKQKAVWRVTYAGGEGRVIPACRPSRGE